MTKSGVTRRFGPPPPTPHVVEVILLHKEALKAIWHWRISEVKSFIVILSHSSHKHCIGKALLVINKTRKVLFKYSPFITISPRASLLNHGSLFLYSTLIFLLNFLWIWTFQLICCQSLVKKFVIKEEHMQSMFLLYWSTCVGEHSWNPDFGFKSCSVKQSSESIIHRQNEWLLHLLLMPKVLSWLLV